METALVKPLWEFPGLLSARVPIPTMGGLEFIEASEIIRISAEGTYSRFYLRSGKNHLVCRALREMEQATAKNGFLRIHRSHVINVNHLVAYRKAGSYVKLTDGSEIRISNGYKAHFLEWVQRIFEGR